MPIQAGSRHSNRNISNGNCKRRGTLSEDKESLSFKEEGIPCYDEPLLNDLYIGKTYAITY